MNYEEISLTGPLLSKEIYKLLKDKTQWLIKNKYFLKDEILEVIGDILHDTSNLISRYDLDISITDLQSIMSMLQSRIGNNTYTLYRERNESYDHRYWIRIYKSKKIKPVKLTTYTKETLIKGQFTDEHEYDVLKVVQWLQDWKICSNIYINTKGELLTLLTKLKNSTQLDKIWKIHFGNEYDDNDRVLFKEALNNMLKLAQYGNPESKISIDMSGEASTANYIDDMED